jgi:hypothetical protein
MIDAASVLREVRGFNKFCSVEDLRTLVDTLRADSGFHVEEAGTSESGNPIYHVRFGSGSVKALFIGFPDSNEPIGGLTVFSLLTLLAARNRALVSADVEWHVVPCIDPDGATLNEGWSQHPFDLERYLRNFHRPAARDQVDCSFPIQYKRLSFDSPTKEARVLMGVIDRVRPDFYYALHNNSGAMGAWLLLSRDIGHSYYPQLQRLLADLGIPIQLSAPFGGQTDRFAEGIYEGIDTRKYYDNLEKSVPDPEKVLGIGGRSYEYAAEINPDVLSFVSELPFVTHPSSRSARETQDSLRRVKLQIDAENKYLTTVMLEEWAKVSDVVSTDNAFYKKVISDFVSVKDRLWEGLPCWPRKTRDTLFNPLYGGGASEGQRFEAYMLERFFVLCQCYEFVRLLKVSKQTPGVVRAIDRLEREFGRALGELNAVVNLNEFVPLALDDLARAQLGSGLIVLNSILELRGST